MNHGFTVWFTGWSGSGKTTLACALDEELRHRGVAHVQRLDGDVVREDLTRDLGFSKEDRDENIRRVTFVAQLLSHNGVATLVAFISPYRRARAVARERCRSFIEVYVRCSREALIARDPKGMYRRALAGEIEGFTGISDPYEEPESPEVVVDTDEQREAESLGLVLAHLERRGLIPKALSRASAQCTEQEMHGS